MKMLNMEMFLIEFIGQFYYQYYNRLNYEKIFKPYLII
jgi:hypothetical protein